MLKTSFGIASVVSLFAFAACAPEGEEQVAGSEAKVISVVPGASIHSPNANPSASYLSGRNIENLRRLGALQGVLNQLAGRVDGALGTLEPDGRVTIDELLAIEQPNLIDKLFPAERNALPDLWRLLETSGAAPATVSVPEIDRILATDVSEVATTPLEPKTILITSLRAELQRVAARLEALFNSDNDVKTVSKADIVAGLASPGSFQPWELDQLKTIEPIFLDRAGTKLVAKVKVPEATPVPTWDLPVVIKWGVASLNLAKGVEYVEKRTKDTETGDLTVSIEGHVIQKVMVTLPTPNQILMLEDGSDTETFVPSGVLEGTAGTKTVEVWANGVRLGSYRANLPAIKQVDEAIDLTRWADYAFLYNKVTTNPDGTTTTATTPLKRNNTETSKTEEGTRFNATFTYTKDTVWSSVDAEIAAQTATPPFTVSPGRYALSSEFSLQLFPEGIVTVSRANGWTERAIYRANQWVLPSGSELRFSYDPKTNQLMVQTREGAPVFSGKLAGSMRTG